MSIEVLYSLGIELEEVGDHLFLVAVEIDTVGGFDGGVELAMSGN